MSETPWRTRQDDIDQVEREKATLIATLRAARWAFWAAVGALVAAAATIISAALPYLVS